MTVALALRLLTVMVLWASCFPLITIGLALAPHLAFAAMRAALAGALLIALGMLFRRPLPRGTRPWFLIAATGLGATSLGFLGMFHAAEFVSPGIATVIANVQPLLAAALAHIFLSERLGANGWLGLSAGIVGIATIAWPGIASGIFDGLAMGTAYIILAAVGVAVGNIAIKRVAGQADAAMAMGFQLLLGAFPLALMSILTENVSLAWSGEFAIVLAILSVFGTSLAFWLWFGALEQIRLNRANAFTFLVPIFGLAIGAALFEERLTWRDVAGIILVLTGVAMVERADARASPLRSGPARG